MPICSFDESQYLSGGAYVGGLTEGVKAKLAAVCSSRSDRVRQTGRGDRQVDVEQRIETAVPSFD